MSAGRVAVRTLLALLSLALLGALLPATALAAPEGKLREYIVSLQVSGSDNVIAPSTRSARQRIAMRSERARNATQRLEREVGFSSRQRFSNAMTGFSAKLTQEQAAELARDAKVAAVRPARRFRISAQVTPPGVKRINAWEPGGSGPDVDADVAVLDTGIGPGDANGDPLPMGPAGAPELNIAGGINCYDNPSTGGINEALAYPGRWADSHWHGTHVAGTIGARDNNVGTVGVAPGVRLWAVRVFGGVSGSEAAIICGLDWAIATHNPQSSTPPIDVINMSIQGPRLDSQEDCDQILADPRGDPIHQGVCRATAIGITVVAAAGNSSYNANNSSPGGYDQVISVGAMTDVDGTGWGKGGVSPCSGESNERDDTFASYSNFGREIDIVAPGTCVESTWPTTSGAVTTRSSGTSMAAPHVTGAVARYLADHPGTPPERMRRIVRAAGRLDWKAKSDPVWYGVRDPDDPNRVLDVKALTEGPMLKSWVFHDSFTVAGTSRTRTTRVDVQRGGGYDGTATLDLTGLPGAVGTAAFGETSLSGLGGLGTDVTLNLKTSGPDGRYGLGVEVNGPGVSAFSRGLRLTVDRTGPEVSGLSPRVRGGRAPLTTKGAAQTFLQWSVDDEYSSIKRVSLQRKTGSGPWRDVGTTGKTSSLVTLKPGQANRFRVKATDSLGNRSTSDVVEARLSVRDSSSSQWFQPASGGWKTKKAKRAYGGSLLLANSATDSLSTSFKGKAVAVAGAVGPARGSFQVRVDGGEWQSVRLKADKAGQRKVVWSRILEDGQHTVEIQGKSGQTALDAILILR